MTIYDVLDSIESSLTAHLANLIDDLDADRDRIWKS
jgi:hypothetical protein